MKRDKKGRFSKEEDENDSYNINLALPSFRSLLYWHSNFTTMDSYFCKI